MILPLLAQIQLTQVNRCFNLLQTFPSIPTEQRLTRSKRNLLTGHAVRHIKADT
jgi:hypothetical protein